MNKDNYLHQKKLWLRIFRIIANNKRAEQNCFRKYFDQDKIASLKKQVQIEFENLLPEVPYIGTMRENPYLIFLIFTVISLSFYRVLKRQGWPVEKIGQIIYEIADNFYSGLNPILKRILRWYMGSSILQKRYRRTAKNKKIAQNPWNYKAKFIPGDGKNFLFGMDYMECGGLKFLKAQNVAELAPYLCLSDYAMSRALKIGFKRTCNLALGGKICDFRFYKNFDTPSGWPPDKLPEYKNIINKK